MFNHDIKILHLEPTTVCNAACPQCSRENTNLYNNNVNQSELSLSQCRELFSVDFIKKLDKLYMCGDFGDPTANTNIIEIFKYFRQCNPSITLGMNTNGSIQNTAWWHKIGNIFSNPKDYVVFSIDGLEDTNHLYRRNVSWHKVIENASEFIKAGGSAHWDMLVFNHNQHQVDDAIELAKNLGFKWFRSKVSKRFIDNPIEGLSPPTNLTLPNITSTKIKCKVFEDKSLYVSANGKKLPCCWIGNFAFNMDEKLKDMLDSNNWADLINSWDTTPHHICTRICGVNDDNKSSFELQWNKEIQLD